MKSRRSIPMAAAALALVVSAPLTVRADDKDKDNKAASDVIVHFGQPQPQGTPPATTHFLLPDDVTIRKGGTVNFIVNGGGHGIAIHRVSKNTTREDIAADLCQGPPGTAEDDRASRSLVCNGAIVTGVDAIVGTQNLAYQITDGKDDLVIDVPQNPPTNPNPRVDDTEHSDRLLATSGRATGDTTVPGANPAGAFLAGSTPTAPGNRIRVQFLKTGRYLVVCMNRGHALNDHMFGFVNVTGEGNDDE